MSVTKDRQYEQLVRELAEATGGRLGKLEAKLAEKFREQAKDVDQLRESVDQARADYRKRFSESMERFSRLHSAGRLSDGYVAACRDLGDLAAGIAAGDDEVIRRAQGRMQTAAGTSPITGERGGFLIPEAMIDVVVRNVETSGVADRNANVVTVASTSGKQARRTGGPSVYYPDYGMKPSVSDAKIASVRFEMVRYAVLMVVDRWMLNDSLREQLGQFIAEEIIYSATRATDANVFVGDGGDSYARVSGVFNNPNIPAVTADAGDNTFGEVISKFPAYLTACLGALPDWADNENTKVYAHRSIWWSWLGHVDQHGRPLLDLVLTDKPRLLLLGYPFEHVPAAPKLSDSAASKAMLVAGDLSKGVTIFRYPAGYELRRSDEARFLEGEIVFLLDLLQDVKTVDPAALVRLVTNAA